MKRIIFTVFLVMLCTFTGCRADKEIENPDLSTKASCMGLEVELQQNLSEYTEDDPVVISLNIVNRTGLHVSELAIKNDYSNALMLSETESKIKADPMNMGDSQSFQIVLVKAPLYRRVLNSLWDGIRALGNWMWQFIRTHLLFDLITMGCLTLFILAAVVIRKVQNAKLRKKGIDPKTYRKQIHKEKRAAKKEKKRLLRQEKRQKKAEAQKMMILLLCTILTTECILGGVPVQAAEKITEGINDVTYSSDDYTMEISHDFFMGDKEYTYTATISFTLTLIMVGNDMPEDPYYDELLETVQPLEQRTAYEWKDSAISAVSVSCQTEKGTGELLISDCSGESWLKKTAGLIGNPVDITLVGDNMTGAEIAFTYVPKELGDIDETGLGIVWYDEVNDKMILMENSRVDIENHTISLETSHFSKYAVVDTQSWYKAWEKAQYVSRGGTADFPEFFNIVLAVDCSGSMDGEKNELSKEAAYQFTTHLEDNDLFTILKFSDQASVVVPPSYTGDTDVDVLSAINSIGIESGTNFDSGLTASLSALNELNTKRKYNPYYAGVSKVEGCVTDEEGNPLEGVTISFYIQAEPDYSMLTPVNEVIQPDHQIITDENGIFAIECSNSCYLKITYEKEKYDAVTKMITTSREKTVDASAVLSREGYGDHPLGLGKDNGLYSVQQLIVFLSDGQASVSNDTYNDLVNSGCKVITIGLGKDVSSRVLQEIAEKTGGVYIFSEDPSELESVYEIIWGTYIGVSPEDTDGDGIPDAVEKSGMKNQYGEMVHPNPDYADTDGDGYSDAEEMGYFDEESGLFEMVSEPTVPSRYVSDAKLKFMSSGKVSMSGNQTKNMIAENDGSEFKVTVGLAAVQLEYPQITLPDGTLKYDYLSETVYASPEDAEIWVTYKDKCLDVIENHYTGVGLKADGSSTAARTFSFSCSKGGLTCNNSHKIEIHAKAANAKEIVLELEAQDIVRQQWIDLVQKWLDMAEQEVRRQGTDFIRRYVEAAARDMNGEQQVRDKIQFTTATRNDALSKAIKQWMEEDYLTYVKGGYEASITETTYDTDSAAGFIKSVARKIENEDLMIKITADGKTYSFNVTRTAVNGIIQWTFMGNGSVYYGATSNMETAMAQYLNDLKKLGESQLDKCREKLSVLEIAKDTLEMSVLDPLLDQLDRKTCRDLLEDYGLNDTFYNVKGLCDYLKKTKGAYKKCIKDGTDNMDITDVKGMTDAIFKFSKYLVK